MTDAPGSSQGSILRPLLFLIYLNDIVDDISCHISLFADDTSLLEIVQSWGLVQVGLNSNLGKLESWSKKWKLSFNVKKSVYMTFSNKGNPPDFPLLLNNLPLSRVKSNKHLGLIFNDQITWSDHINYICSKASKQLGLLFKNKKCFNRNVLI